MLWHPTYEKVHSLSPQSHDRLDGLMGYPVDPMAYHYWGGHCEWMFKHV